MDLQEIRNSIDNIDKELASLFVRRMECAAAVAESKKDTGTAVINTAREQAVIAKAMLQAGKHEGFIARLFKAIIGESRALQHERLASSPDIRNMVSHESIQPDETTYSTFSGIPDFAKARELAQEKQHFSNHGAAGDLFAATKAFYIPGNADTICLFFQTNSDPMKISWIMNRISAAGAQILKMDLRPAAKTASGMLEALLYITGNISCIATMDAICAIAAETDSFWPLANFHGAITA